MSSRSRWRSRSRSADLTLVSDRAVSQIGAGRSMLVNLVPEFLAVLAAPDPAAAYSEYLDRHGPVLTSYWQNYVLDPASPHAERVIAAALRADRSDLKRLLEDVDVVSISEDALQRSEEHTSELQSRFDLVCRLLLEKKKKQRGPVGGRVAARHLDRRRRAAREIHQHVVEQRHTRCHAKCLIYLVLRSRQRVPACLSV